MEGMGSFNSINTDCSYLSQLEKFLEFGTEVATAANRKLTHLCNTCYHQTLWIDIFICVTLTLKRSKRLNFLTDYSIHRSIRYVCLCNYLFPNNLVLIFNFQLQTKFTNFNCSKFVQVLLILVIQLSSLQINIGLKQLLLYIMF